MITEHSLTVAQLQELLAQLQSTDLLIVNQVRNFAIVRNDQQIGFIDLLAGFHKVEWYDPTENTNRI